MSVGLNDIYNSADGTITNKHEKDFHDHHQILCFTQLFESKSERMTLVERKANCLMMICGLRIGKKKGEH